MKLISYQRSATKKNSSEPNSIPKQRSACNIWATRNKHEIIERYYDEGFGGYSHLAPSFQVILKKILLGNSGFDGVVVHSHSTITRNCSTFVKIENVFKNHNIKLFLVTENYQI